jgi:hypothetical protein
MDSRFITPLVLPLALISLFANPQTGWAGRCPKGNCIHTSSGDRPSSLRRRVELQKLENSIAQGRAKAADYLRAGELHTQLGDKAMAETRLKEARVLYGNLGNRAGVTKVNQKLQILRGSLQQKTAPSEIQTQPGR